MPERVTLYEYESRVVQLSPALAQRVLAAAGGHLTLSPIGVQNEYVLTATQYVGAVALPEIEVLVRPKIRLENLFLLLEVGFAEESWSSDLVDFASDRGLLAALAAFFARSADGALARGVVRSYRSEEDRLPALRGRIDFPGLLRQPAVLVPIPCRFDDYTADIDENRYLKAAARQLLRVAGVDHSVRRRLLDQVVRLEEVSDVGPPPADIDRIVFTRLNRHYEPALRLARVVLEQLTLVDQFGETGAHAFFLNMNDLFQAFITHRLRGVLGRRLEVEAEPTVYLGVSRRVAMAPDLVFAGIDGRLYVGDVKYKITTSGMGLSPDYYQLLAYTTALDLPEGVLVYCQVDGELPPKMVEARFSGKRLFTYAVDLRGSAEQVERSISELANWIADRARPAAKVAAVG